MSPHRRVVPPITSASVLHPSPPDHQRPDSVLSFDQDVGHGPADRIDESLSGRSGNACHNPTRTMRRGHDCAPVTVPVDEANAGGSSSRVRKTPTRSVFRLSASRAPGFRRPTELVRMMGHTMSRSRVVEHVVGPCHTRNFSCGPHQSLTPHVTRAIVSRRAQWIEWWLFSSLASGRRGVPPYG